MTGKHKFDDPEQGYKMARRYILNNALRRNQKSLDLTNYNLDNLPPEIGTLDNLEVLILDNNQLRDLPDEISRLTNLKHISIRDNHLSEFPDNLIPLRRLRYCDLSENSISRIPTGIRKLVELDILILRRNTIATIPPSIQHLINLTYLDLSENSFESFPDQLYACDKLKILKINDNSIRELSTGVKNLKSIEHICLTNNEIRTLPSELSFAQTLKHLELGSNEFREFPFALTMMTGLINLNMDDNSIKTLPESMQKLASLRVFSFARNFVERIPQSIGSLSNAEEIDLSGNSIESLPDSIAGCRRLRVLNLSDNIMTEIPDGVSLIYGLTTLNIQRNHINKIDHTLSRLTNLIYLGLDGNKIDELPDFTGIFKRLKVLSLDDNTIEEIPESITSIPYLSRLSLKNNNLSKLPDSLRDYMFDLDGPPDRCGLAVMGNRLAYPLSVISKMEQPKATLLIQDWLNDRLDYDQIKNILDDVADDEIDKSFPGIPSQENGPHFELGADNIIEFAPPEAFDAQGNNINRLRRLYPAMKEIVAQLIEALGRGNIPQSTLRDRAVAYSDLLCDDLSQIDLSLLYVAGVRLANAESALRQDVELPALSAPARELVESLITIHGTFMLSTTEGIESIALEERYKLSPTEERRYRDAAVRFAEQLHRCPELIKPDAARFIHDVSAEINAGHMPERSGVVATGALRNVVITLASLATVSLLATSATNSSTSLTTAGAAAGSWLGLESLKKTKIYAAATNLIGQSIDKILEGGNSPTFHRTRVKLSKQLDIIRQLEPHLLDISKIKRDFDWIDKFFTWFKIKK